MGIKIGKGTPYIERIKNTSMVAVLSGGVALMLSGLLIHYYITNVTLFVTLLLDDIISRIIVLPSCITISVILLIMGSHLLVDTITVSKDIESRLRLTNSRGLKVWKMIPSILYGCTITSSTNTLLSCYYDYYLREYSTYTQERRDMRGAIYG